LFESSEADFVPRFLAAFGISPNPNFLQMEFKFDPSQPRVFSEIGLLLTPLSVINLDK
jgi:hypothetical protein